MAVPAEQVQADRQSAWKEIQVRSPDVAEFLSVCAQAFGKPEGVQVRIGDDTLIDTLPLGESNYERDKRLRRENLRRYRQYQGS